MRGFPDASVTSTGASGILSFVADVFGSTFSPGAVLLTAATAEEIRCPVTSLIAGCAPPGLPAPAVYRRP